MNDFSNEFSNRVLELLANPKTVNAIREAHLAAYREEFATDAVEDPEKDGHPRPSAWHQGLRDRIEYSCYSGLLHDIFEHCVIEKLHLPSIIEITELEETFCSTMHVSPKDFESAYDLFVGNVDQEILIANESAPFIIAKMPHQEVKLDEESQIVVTELLPWHESESGFPIWSRNGISVDVVGTGLAEGWAFPSTPVYARVRGIMSDKCCSALHANLV